MPRGRRGSFELNLLIYFKILKQFGNFKNFEISDLYSISRNSS
jgi:hypothetical protein